MKLIEYVKQYTAVKDFGSGGLNVGYFEVLPVDGAKADELKALIAEHAATSPLDLFDSAEHCVQNLAEWAYDSNDGPAARRETALRLMALGDALGLWHLNTPKSVLGEAIPEFLELLLLSQGMVTISTTPRNQEVKVIDIDADTLTKDTPHVLH